MTRIGGAGASADAGGSQVDPPSGHGHPEMDLEAEASANDVPSYPTGPSKDAPTKWSETYSDELQKNLQSHRTLRKVAFWTVGVTGGLYLIALLWTLWGFFHRGGLYALLFLARGQDWHVLILVGVVLTIFAAIPITLVMGLVRMISERDDPGSKSNVKTPNGEFIRLLAEALAIRRADGG